MFLVGCARLTLLSSHQAGDLAHVGLMACQSIGISFAMPACGAWQSLVMVTWVSIGVDLVEFGNLETFRIINTGLATLMEHASAK